LQALFIITYVIGLITAASGLFSMLNGSNATHAMFNHGRMYGGVMVIVGSLLMVMPSVLTILSHSFLGSQANPQAILSTVPQTDNTFRDSVQVILNTLVLFGWFFSVRGMTLLARASSRQEKGLGRGTTMLIAGVVLSNPVITAIILGASVGAEQAVSIILPT